MGTRAIIKIEGYNGGCVYKHWDGYPEGMVPWLEDFNKDFTEKRGNDHPYKLAQLVRSSVRLGEKHGLDDNNYTGWGIYPIGVDMGQEYEYTLMNDGSVKVHDVYASE
jgi:hypothetical protein